MPSAPVPDLTQLLVEWRTGNRDALDQLMPLVYRELQTLASRYLSRERAGHTLQATALVNEAYLKLIDQRNVQWQNRAHFLGIAARLMRRILIDHARRRGRAKRGSAATHITLVEGLAASEPRDIDAIALDDALVALEKLDPQQAQMVELRFFGGLTVEETAEVLGISEGTVKREWRVAKAWLYRHIQTGEGIT
ncbi:MAG TPA: sigma-70 family RNA polymerase sigma factor [Vicinamibacterales bacterium]|nr:sigma-70 family RNA polymerase sigma factor [Vicinamibacterales bacterium]